MASDAIDVAALQRDIRRAGKKLDTLAVKTQKTILRKATRASLKPISKRLRQNTPTDQRDLKFTYGTQVRTKAGVIGAVGQSTAKKKRRGAVDLHLPDQGTSPHTIPAAQFVGDDGELIRADVQHPGTRGQEFVEQTAKETLPQANREFARKLDTELMAEAGKLGTK